MKDWIIVIVIVATFLLGVVEPFVRGFSSPERIVLTEQSLER